MATTVSTAVLKAVPLFASFPDEQLRMLTGMVTRRSAARSTTIMAAGDATDSLYIVLSGRLKVMMSDADGKEVILSILGPGEFFGEMALLTGDARSATVVAKTDVECYRLDRASFQGLRLSRPEIADGMSEVIASRKPELEKVREAFATPPQPVPTESADLLRKIQRFFGLRR